MKDPGGAGEAGKIVSFMAAELLALTLTLTPGGRTRASKSKSKSKKRKKRERDASPILEFQTAHPKLSPPARPVLFASRSL